MDAKLVVVGGKASKNEVKLKLPTVLGRSRDAGLAIAHPNVSRRHCEIREVEGALVVKDLGSSNGTLVNDVIVKEIVLKPGDMLTVGPLVFRAEYKHAGKFPSLGKDSPKAAVADTLEFAPDELTQGARSTQGTGKPAAEKTAAKERKTSAAPPPEAKKPQPSKEEPPKKEVDAGGRGKLEKASKPQEVASDLDDLSLPDLEDMPAASGKKPELDDLPDLPSLDEPAVAEWGETETKFPADEADADLALPSAESESLPDLSDELEMPEPESLAEEPDLERSELPALEETAADPLDSLSELEPKDDLALADDLPSLEEVASTAAEPALDLPDDLLFEESPAATEESAADLVDESAALPAAAEDAWEPMDELGSIEDMPLEEEVPAAAPEAEALEAESAWADESPLADAEPAEAAEVDDLAALPLEEPQEVAEIEEELAPEELGELGLMDATPPIAEAATQDALEPDPAWFAEPALEKAEQKLERAEDEMPELAFAEPEEAAAVEEVKAEDEIDELGLIEEETKPQALEPDPLWLEEPAAARAEAEVEAAEDDLPEMKLEELEEPEEVEEIAAAEAEPAADEIGELGLIEEEAEPQAVEPDPSWLEEPAAAKAEAEVEPAEDELPEMNLAELEEPEEVEEVAAADAEPAVDAISELGLIEEDAEPQALEPDPSWLEEPVAAKAEAEVEPAEDDLPEMSVEELEEPEEVEEVAAAEAEPAVDELGELGLIEEESEPRALEPEPSWLEELVAAKAEAEVEAAEDDLPEMNLEEPEEVREVAAAEVEPAADEIGELGLIEEEAEPKALEPDPSWLEERALAKAEAEVAAAEDGLPEMKLEEFDEVEEVAAVEVEPAADEIGELGLTDEVPEPQALEPDPSWLEEPAAAKAEAEAAEDDLPEMNLEEPEEVGEVAAAEAEPPVNEIDDLGLIEEEAEPKALEPEPSWLEEPAAAKAEAEVEPAEDELPEMFIEESEEVEEVAAVEVEPAADEISELDLIEETPEPQALEPDPAWLEEPAEAEVEAAEDDLPEMFIEESEEVEEVAGAELESGEDALSDLGLIEESPEVPLAEIPVAEDELADLILNAPDELPEVAAVEEENLVEDEIGELGLIEEDSPAPEAAIAPPERAAFEPDPSWFDEPPQADLPPAADVAPTSEEFPEPAEPLAEGDFDDLEPEPMPAVASAEIPASPVDEEPELDWLDGGSPEPGETRTLEGPIEELAEASLEALGSESADVESKPRVRSDLPTATHEFTSVDPLDRTEENLPWEPAESQPTDEAEEPLDFDEAPPSLPEVAADALDEEIPAETAEESDEEIAAELPPAAPWQAAHEETVAWAPSTEEPPPFSLQPEPERPAFFADPAPRASSAKQPQPAKKKKGWSLFGWLKKKEKPAQASSAPAPAAPLPLPTPTPEPSFDEAEAPVWSTESLSEEQPVAEFTPESFEAEADAALDLPEIEFSDSEAADLEPALDFPPETEIAGMPPAEHEPQWDEPNLDDANPDEPEFAPAEPPTADLDESSEEIDVGPPIADLSEWEPEPEESAEALAQWQEPAEAVTDLGPLEEVDSEDLPTVEAFGATGSLEEDSSDEISDLELPPTVAFDAGESPDEEPSGDVPSLELPPLEAFGAAESWDEEPADEVAELEMPPVAETAEQHDLEPVEQEDEIPWAEELAMRPQENKAMPPAVPSAELSDDPWADELAAMAADHPTDGTSVPLAEMNDEPWNADSVTPDAPIPAAELPAEERLAEEGDSGQAPPAMPWQVEHEETVAWTPSTDESPGFTLQAEADRPVRYSEVEARAAKANKPSPPAKKKGWSLFGWFKKKEKPTKTVSPAPPAAPPQFAPSLPEPSFEETESPPSWPGSMSHEPEVADFAADFAADEPNAALDLPGIDLPESDEAEFEPELEFSSPESAEVPPAGFEPTWDEPGETASEVDDLDDDLDSEEPELSAVEPPLADLDEPSDEFIAEEPIADLPEWESEPDELPEELPSLEPVAEDLPPLETESDALPPLEAVEELKFDDEEISDEELSEELPPLGSPPVAHANASDDDQPDHEQDATMQWGGDPLEFLEEPEEIAEAPAAASSANLPVEPPAAGATTAASPAAEPAAAENLPEFMRPKPTPKAVSGEDDDLNKFFQELGLK